MRRLDQVRFVGRGLAPTDAATVSGDITVLTNRTDLVTDGTMQQYADQFKQLYPKVNVKFEGITDYEGEVRIRMNTEHYGDVLLIPNTVSTEDYPRYFASLGAAGDVAAKYSFTDKAKVGDKVYGVAGFAYVNGFVYNTDVWRRAGVAQWPTTPEEFIADLQAIRMTRQETP